MIIKLFHSCLRCPRKEHSLGHLWKALNAPGTMVQGEPKISNDHKTLFLKKQKGRNAFQMQMKEEAGILYGTSLENDVCW
jgi:hypothetical protein